MSKVYQILTDKVLSLIDKGVVPWRQTWQAGKLPMNYDKRAYNGCNLFLLSILCELEGWQHPIFLTFNQIKKLGGKIKEGQEKRHNPVFYWNWNCKKVDPVTGDEDTFPMFRFFLVWNIEQVEGVDLPKWATATKPAVPVLDACEAVVAGYKNGPTIKHGGNRACYNPPLDLVSMPLREDFDNAESYYATMFHELAHSTGHANRLNRKGVTDPIRFGSHDYSQEELVAELTATFLCNETGIATERVVANSAAYLRGWWAKLKSEPKLFAMASAQAVKAAKHILGSAEEAASEEETETAQAA